MESYGTKKYKGFNMTKYPISHNAGKPLDRYFYELLTFHIPPGKNVKILDPTCGKRYLWKYMLTPTLSGKRLIDEYEEVTFSDIRDFGYNIVSDFRDLDYEHEYDGIIFDSPYFFGYTGSSDKRKEDYGDYCQTYEELVSFMVDSNKLFPNWLKSKGKVILKCSDQYNVEERKFYSHHITWEKKYTNFNLIDFNLFIHHRMSPTAFQVKDRPSSVIMHTYFMSFSL